MCDVTPYRMNLDEHSGKEILSEQSEVDTGGQSEVDTRGQSVLHRHQRLSTMLHAKTETIKKNKKSKNGFLLTSRRVPFTVPLSVPFILA